MDRSRRVTYRAGLLDHNNLTSEQEIDNALAEFATVISRVNYHIVLTELLDKWNIVTLVLSGIDDEIGLTEWILSDFPADLRVFEESFACRLLAELANFFLFYSSTSSADEDTTDLLRSHHRVVHLAPKIIRTLLTMTFSDDDKRQSDISRSHSGSSSAKNGRTRASQNQRRKAWRAAQEASIDETPFVELQIPIPKNRTEADDLSRSFLLLLQEILGVFLEGIKRADVAGFLKSMFIPQGPFEAVTIETQPAKPQSAELISSTTTEEHSQDQVPSPFPTIPPMAMAFYFDTPDDFGRWRILLALQAKNDIRQFRQRDKESYAMILAKLKELSNGFFVTANQKHLSGSPTDVPIFKAKVSDSKDLYIVYGVDCVTDYYDNLSEVQALRVFGIFPWGQIDHGLWKSVSRFLGTHGREYQKRCVLRTADPDNDDVFIPRTFPSRDEVSDDPKPIDYLDLPAADINQLHHIISLEKYVMVSKALLETIDANRDANFPFEVSKREREIIRYPSSCYVIGRSGTGKTTTMLFKMLLVERCYQLSDRSQPPPRQMFVTKSGVLVGKVEDLFATYFSSLTFASHIDEGTTPGENDLRGGPLPEKFTDLRDRHFPLFVTFDQLCMMIKADIDSDDPKDQSLRATSTRHSSRKNRQLVDFDRFVAEYWPHFSQSLTAGYNALPVWNEIMGIILGSEGTLHPSKGYLDRQAYHNLSLRTAPDFSDRRNGLYDIFVSYTERKKELQDIDTASRTQDIIRFIEGRKQRDGSNENAKAPDMQTISHLYVDETQDNLLIDTFLLRLLCKNADGLFWAGDTAQTISAGSSFRFNDLKAFQYRIQNKLHRQTLNVRLQNPGMFYLPVNYRSHVGIVNCAQSVLDVINRFWQDSIDSLPRERGNVHGAKPIFYTDVYREFVRECRFLSRDSKKSMQKIELGAHQCILVRDDEAKEKLSKEIGHEVSRELGLILTLYDSKGLEFNDVVLYNFFQDSPVNAADWRLVLHEISSEISTLIRAPPYKHGRHATLCSELKGLYVAVTRARNNLRIIDESTAAEPMRLLWESRDQVMSCKPGEEPIDFAAPSDNHEWANRAQLFFERQKWHLAFQCYEKIGDKQAAAIADAHYQREKARRIPTSNALDRTATFVAAAKAFVNCAQSTDDTTNKRRYYKLGAECYEDSDKPLLAAETYRQGGQIVEAMTLFYELARLDDVHSMITKLKPNMVSIIPDHILKETKSHYISRKEYRKAGQLFESADDHLQFLVDENMNRELVDGLLLQLDRIEDVVAFYLSKGETTKAIDLFLNDKKDKVTSRARAKVLIMEKLWHLTSLGIPSIDQSEVNKLRARSHRVDIDVNEQEEICMFHAIAHGHRGKLSELANSFMGRGNLAASVLCFDHYFNEIPALLEPDIEKVMHDIKQFYDYVNHLQDLALLEDPINDLRVKKLFGIQTGEVDGAIALLHNSLLYDYARQKTPIRGKDILPNEFIGIFQGSLNYRLLDRVTRENDACVKAPALLPCLNHLFTGCDLPYCSLSHIHPDATWFQNQVSAHLLQISIYQGISRIQFASAMMTQRRFWLIKLYEILYPTYQTFRPTSSVLPNLGSKAIPVILEWAHAVSQNLQSLQSYMFLTFAMVSAEFSLVFNRYEGELQSFPLHFSRRPYNELQDMLKNLSWDSASNVPLAIDLIRLVLDDKIVVNIYVFCSFIERICALLIVCNRFQQRGNVHYVMLPRSWLKATLEKLDVNKVELLDGCLQRLLQAVERLIWAVIVPQNQFRVGPEFHVVESQGIIQAISISRLCRVLGLLAYNVPVEQFRSDILTVFGTIQRKSPLKLSVLYEGYVKAKTFGDVHVAICESMRNGTLDEMVKPAPAHHIEEPVRECLPVRNLVYSTHDELLSLLQAEPDGQWDDIIPSSQSHDKTPPLAHEPWLEQKRDLEADLDTSVPRSMSGHGTHSHEFVSYYEGNLEPMTHNDTTTKLDHGHKTRGQDLASTTELRGGKTQGEADLSFDPGPLPKLCNALKPMRDLLVKEKKRQLARLTQTSGNKQDEVNATITSIQQAMKTFQGLQQQMEPDSTPHSEQDMNHSTRVIEKGFDFIQTVQSLIEIPEHLHEFKSLYNDFLQEASNPGLAAAPGYGRLS